MTKLQLIKTLESTGEDVSSLKSKTKQELEQILESKQASSPKDDVCVVSTSESEVLEESAQSEVPEYLSPEWSKYVMSQLRPEELVDKVPTTDGLRRLFNQLIGPIQENDVELLQAPLASNLNNTTVKYTLVYHDFRHDRAVRLSEIANCSLENTKFPYSKYTSSTACTMAEGRIYRKKLGLKGHTFEEAMVPDQNSVIEQADDQTKITDAQINAISNICTKLGLDTAKFIDSICGIPKNLLELSHIEAQNAMRKLNNYRRGPSEKGGEAIPDTLYKKK